MVDNGWGLLEIAVSWLALDAGCARCAGCARTTRPHWYA